MKPLIPECHPRHREIWEKVLDRVEVDPVTGCWVWTGPTSGNGRGGGYPRMNLDGQTVAVHRVTTTLYKGYIPGKKQVDHVCRNRLCVCPFDDHHEIVTHKRNQRRRDRAARERKHHAQHQTEDPRTNG